MTHPGNHPLRIACAVLVAGMLHPAMAGEAVAPAVEPAAVQNAASEPLFPGDLLQVEVYDNPDLAVSVRVPSEGPAQFPLIGQVEGLRRLTADTLAALLKQRLEADYLRHALVTVTVKEYGPRRAFVMGGVARPSSIAIDPGRSATAIRAISEAGGLVEDADRSGILVVREKPDGGTEALPVSISGQGDALADVALRPNDLIVVPRLDRVYVTGQVKQPGGVSIPGQQGLTVSRAVSLAGGFDRYARSSQVQLLRAGQAARELDVDEILAGHGEDPALRPGDMVYVPQRRY